MTQKHKHLIPPKNEVFFQVWHKFTANAGSLWLFSEQIARMADKLDQDKVQEIALEMADIFDDDPKEVEKELLDFLPALDDLDIYPNFYENANVRETFQFFKSNDFKERVLEWALENVGKAQKLAHIITTYFAEPPANGVILRRSALVTLITFLEILFEDLLFVYFYYVESLSEEKSHKKAENIRGWKNRIETLKGFGIHFGVTETYIDELYEIHARRNRIVHGDGIVTERYLKNAPEIYHPDGIEEGQMLIVSTRYLIRAFHVITLIAFQITQSAWRQWRPNKNRKKANEALERFIFSTLKQKRYELVKGLSVLCDEIKLTKKHEQFIIVNHAVALRELGKIQEMQKITSRLRSQKRDWRVNIAYAILKNNDNKARLLLTRAAEKNKLVNISKYWPVFNPVQDEDWFQNIFDTADRGKLPNSTK
jgi:hypothetical protein